MFFRPITNAVVIRPDADANVYQKDGVTLYLPVDPTPKKGFIRGTVVLTGPGNWKTVKRGGRDVVASPPQRVPTGLTPGDRVVYGTWEGTTGPSDRHLIDIGNGPERLDVLAAEYVELVICESSFSTASPTGSPSTS